MYQEQDNDNENNNATPSLLHQRLHSSQQIHNIKPKYEITTRKFEINQLVGMFLGKRIRKIYEFMSVCMIVSGTWAFAAVFGEPLATEIPIYHKEDEEARIYIMIFGVIVIPVSMLNFTEQKYLQIVMTILRYVVVFCISTLSIILLYSTCQPEK
eukprot:56951_1